jgi:cathepsin H
MKIKYNLNDKLSVQEVIECATNPWYGTTLGCRGGWDFSVYEHSYYNFGVTTEKIKPYGPQALRTCNVSNPRTKGSRVVNYFDVPEGDEGAIKLALYQNGPVYVTLYVSKDLINYKSGIYTDSLGLCGNYWNNHAVLLVGYGTENGIDYWIVKNSWSADWGESGYFRIQRGKNLCGIANDASYVVLQ